MEGIHKKTLLGLAMLANNTSTYKSSMVFVVIHAYVIEFFLRISLLDFSVNTNSRIETVTSLKLHSQKSKQLQNSPILLNNHELRGIVVNKGRIYREFR